VVSGVGLGIRVLDGIQVLQGEGEVSGFFVPIGFNGVFFEHAHASHRWTDFDD